MMRPILLLAVVLATAAPAPAQRPPSVPTPAERDKMAQDVESLTDSVRAAERRATALQPGDDPTEARADVRQFRQRLDDLRDNLATADERIEAARQARRRPEPNAATESDSASEATGPPARALQDDTGPDVTTTSGSAAAAPTDGDEQFPLVLGGIAALGVLGGAAWWFFQKRKTKPSSRLVPRPDGDGLLPGQTVPRHEFDSLARQVQTLGTELRDLREWTRADYERRQAPAAPAAAPPAPAPAASALAPADAAASAFADWCRQGTPMMSRVDFFAGMLATRVPGASARAVYRDLNSQAEPVRFDDRGGASPAEFWLVSVGGETLLFPQPLTAGQFRELTRVFDGTAAPRTLGRVVPARVRDEGGAVTLAAPGRVS